MTTHREIVSFSNSMPLVIADSRQPTYSVYHVMEISERYANLQVNRRQTNPLHYVLEQKEMIRVVKLMTSCVSNHCSLELFWGIDHPLCGLRTRTRAAARIWYGLQSILFVSDSPGLCVHRSVLGCFLIGFDRPSVCVGVERWICVNVFVCVCLWHPIRGKPTKDQPRIAAGGVDGGGLSG